MRSERVSALRCIFKLYSRCCYCSDFIHFTAEELECLQINCDPASMSVLNIPATSAASTPRKVRLLKKGGTPATFQKFWTAAEDCKLEQLVNDLGFKWAMISREFGEGIHPRKQCRDRFLYQLKKDTRRNPWTEAEQMQLLRLQHANGNKWIEFAKNIKTHSENAVRHYWRSCLRGLTEKYLTLTNKINKDALVSNYNFGDFQHLHLECLDYKSLFLRANLRESEAGGRGLRADAGLHPRTQPRGGGRQEHQGRWRGG